MSSTAACEAARIGQDATVRCLGSRVRSHSTTATRSACRTFPDEPDLRGCNRSRPRPFWVIQIAIIASATLPEPVTHESARLSIFHPREKAGADVRTCDNALIETGRLIDVENLADRVERFTRPDEQVDVLWHNDVGPEIESMPLSCSIDRFDEPQATRSFERNGRRQKQENVSAWAWPGSL